jgi:cysteine-rich repeat protein
MRSLNSIHRLFAIAITAAVLGACGFGDDRNHLADDGGDDAPAACGDGAMDPGEDCDDGGDLEGDGCDADCEVEPGWSCIGEPSECTPGEGECGDGAIANGEDCDDDDIVNGDGCDADCEIEAGWECSGSPSDCDLLCGNGAVDPGEECDGGDDCDASCMLIATTACTLVPQTGCDPGMACDLGDTEPTECRDVTANGQSDSLCTSVTRCAAGFTCVSQDANTSSCMKFCNIDSQCPGVGARCLIGLTDENGDPIPDVEVCSNSCNPVAQTGCPNGLGCLPFDMTGGDFTDCLDMGTRLDGQSCSDHQDCLEGSLCVDEPGGGSTCHAMCDLDGPDFCPGSQVCTGFVDVILLGSLEVGACN